MSTSSSKIIGLDGLISASGGSKSSGKSGGGSEGVRKSSKNVKAKSSKSSKGYSLKAGLSRGKSPGLKGTEFSRRPGGRLPVNPGKSDRILKENIDLVGKSESGVNIYEFDYKDKSYGEGRYRGVMAQEVPEASSTGSDGYLEVDYSKVDVDFERLD